MHGNAEHVEGVGTVGTWVDVEEATWVGSNGRVADDVVMAPPSTTMEAVETEEGALESTYTMFEPSGCLCKGVAVSRNLPLSLTTANGLVGQLGVEAVVEEDTTMGVR